MKRTSILESLFYGEISPWENLPENKETFQQLNQSLSQLSDTLESRLDEESKALLDQYLSGRADLEAMYCCENFKEGFRLGVQLVLEAFKIH